MLSAIQQLHDLERQGAIGWPFEGKIIVRLGCPLDDKFDTDALVSSFAEAEEWLRKAEHLPPGPKSRAPNIVDELFAAGVPVTALWVFEHLFQATFAPPEDTTATDDWVRAYSWTELEQKLRTEAYRRRPDLTRRSLAPARTREAIRRIDEQREAAAKPTVPAHLMKIAAPVREMPRGATRQLMEETIVKLCRGRFLTMKQLAHLLGRKPDTLRNDYVKQMVTDGRLRLRFPAHHKLRQAYGAPKRK